ncbi:flavin-containing monooxygenase [Leucobacter chinensis]|uniref:flavin-containing monooxygenase n=1 Tax=Leucobacter chinensis TaxID=2851010 RepID=UPI001C2102A7|nr:NAD(P)/FAD-dependent oxidoreductase [Leucobacter chinensis]
MNGTTGTADATGTRRRLRVAIIGAGLGGIGAAVYMKKHLKAEVVIFEAADHIGGTWYRNRFPGAEVDTPSHMYSYSFHRWDWTRPYATQAELVEYMEATVTRYGLERSIRTSTRVHEARWIEGEHQWVVTSDAGVESFDAVMSAVGMLSDPRIPDWPGKDEFEGDLFHSIEWPEGLDLSGKRVAVVGTGSTASQIVPKLANEVAELTLYQRQPGWVIPKAENVYTDERRAQLRRALPRLKLRLSEFWRREKGSIGGALEKPGSKLDTRAKAKALAYIESVFSEHPELREAVTPDYPYLGKRPIQSSDFYPTLLREHVTLVPHAVAELKPNGVVDALGEFRHADVIVAATGFKAAEYLSTLPVYGRGGRSLQEHWGQEPQAYLGSMVPDFPNFFMLYGPNTNGYAVLFAMEQQALFAAKALRHMLKKRATSVEVRPESHLRFNRWIDKRLANSSYTLASNYFTSPSGRVVTQWPDGVILFWLMARFSVPNVTRLGDVNSASTRPPRPMTETGM